MVALGEGGPPDKIKAGYYEEKSCVKNHGNGCYNSGLMFINGVGGTKDIVNASKTLLKACNLGVKKACEK